MSTNSLQTPKPLPVPVGQPLDIRQLTTTLIKHYDVHEGLYDLFLEYRMGFGVFGSSPTDMLPSAILGLSKLSITKVTQLGPLTVDASEVNPPKKRSTRNRTATRSGA